jgi:hypothetical protein
MPLIPSVNQASHRTTSIGIGWTSRLPRLHSGPDSPRFPRAGGPFYCFDGRFNLASRCGHRFAISSRTSCSRHTLQIPQIRPLHSASLPSC